MSCYLDFLYYSFIWWRNHPFINISSIRKKTFISSLIRSSWAISDVPPLLLSLRKTMRIVWVVFLSSIKAAQVWRASLCNVYTVSPVYHSSAWQTMHAAVFRELHVLFVRFSGIRIQNPHVLWTVRTSVLITSIEKYRSSNLISFYDYFAVLGALCFQLKFRFSLPSCSESYLEFY